MRISEVLSSKKPEDNKRRNVKIGILITGILSLAIIFFTIYGQHAGLFTISMTNEAHDKGINISTSIDFPEEEPLAVLKVEPVIEVGDMLEGNMEQEEAENTDGQYFDPDRNDYIAYTFYLKNTGSEIIDVNYRLKVLKQYKNIGHATFIKIVETLYSEDKTVIKREEDKVYPQIGLSREHEIDIDIKALRPNQIKKFTVFMWFDGRYTDPSMIGGAIKVDWLFSIPSGSRPGDVV